MRTRSPDKWLIKIRTGDGDEDWHYGYLTREQYNEFMESQEWDDLRREIIERDGGKCVICKATEHLQVHHRTYELDKRTGIIGGNMITVCRKHHRWIHRRYVDPHRKHKWKLGGFKI